MRPRTARVGDLRKGNRGGASVPPCETGLIKPVSMIMIHYEGAFVKDLGGFLRRRGNDGWQKGTMRIGFNVVVDPLLHPSTHGRRGYH